MLKHHLKVTGSRLTSNSLRLVIFDCTECYYRMEIPDLVVRDVLVERSHKIRQDYLECSLQSRLDARICTSDRRRFV